MMLPFLVCVCVGSVTVAVIRRNPSGNAAYLAMWSGLLAAFGHSVGAF